VDLPAATPIHFLDIEVLTRLGAASAIGLLLGLDRELHGHPAGLRTHGLICLAAATMTVSMLALHQEAGAGDPLRMFEAAGAVVGIVAAGLIIVSGGRIHNLTTAVYIWLATVIGIACGAGQWPLVGVATLIGVIMLTLLRIAERYLPEIKEKGD
jgi:putative Mg2+ transporter-C (MgtC) family protein